MKKTTIIKLVLIATGVAMATPPYMWIGTAAIPDYNTTGGPGILLPNNAMWGDKWVAGAQFYTNYNGVTGQPVPYRNMNKVNAQTTWAAVSNGPDRPQSEFFVFGAQMKEDPTGIAVRSWFLGNGLGYQHLRAENLPLGGYNHWALFPDVDGFYGATTAQLSPMFRGLQTAMGFRVVSNQTTWWNNNLVPESLGIFWRNWAYLNLTQWDSFKSAATYMAGNAGVSANISMASAKNGTHIYYNDNFTQANAETAPNDCTNILTYNMY